MLKARRGYFLSVSVAAVAVVFAFSTVDPAYAAERKSIRWAMSIADSYG